MQILLLATAVLAAPTKNDNQKKDKRSYNLPYGFAGYPIGLYGLGTRVIGAQVPLSNNLIFTYPSGLKYEDLLYRRNFGNIISNELALTTIAQPVQFVSDVSALSPISNLVQDRTDSIIKFRGPTYQPVPQPTSTEGSVKGLAFGRLTDETGVSGSIISLFDRLF